MATAQQRGSSLSHDLRRIRETQVKVSGRIQEIRDQLKKIEDSIPPADKFVPQSATCMSGELRIWCIRYVKAPPSKLQDDLRTELARLSHQIKTLRLREKKLTHQAGVRQKASRLSMQFDQRLTEALKDAEKEGSLDESELSELLEGSEKVLMNYVNILRGSPSIENVDAVLKHLTTPSLLGADTSSGKSAEAFSALAEASDTLTKGAQADFDKVPSVANFDRLLSRVVLGQQLGGTTTWSLKKPLSANTTHSVVQGDTLSGIAEKYYGDQSSWPTIYMENFTKLDPAKLQVGTVLKIP